MRSRSRNRRRRKGVRVAGQPEKGPVRGGMKSGLLRVLPEGSEAQIHAAALDVLETVGLADAPESARNLVTEAGGHVNEAGRLCFPRALVEDTIAKANRSFVICGQDPRHDIEPHGTRVYFGTGGGTINIVDPKTRRYAAKQDWSLITTSSAWRCVRFQVSRSTVTKSPSRWSKA